MVLTSMTERITITIPNDLHKRLQAVKDSLNVSGICQEAINLAVRIEEIKNEEPPNMDTLIKRLRLEKEKEIAESREAGITDGKQDAMELSYAEFRSLELHSKSGLMPDDLYGWLEHTRLQYIEIDYDKNAYLEGWAQGVLNVWEQAKNQL